MSAPPLPALLPHHQSTIDNLVAAMSADPSVLALILGGSLAHGFAGPDSDVDVAIVVSSGDLARRRAAGVLHYNNTTLCTYPGYIDGKYLDLAFLRLVAERGSDPARYAFKDSRILFSRVAELPELLADAVRYPVEQKASRLARFAAQLLAWRWYYGEAAKKQNPYLTGLAVQKLVLFSSRLILTVNERLYPYHKWLLRELAADPRRPVALVAAIQRLPVAHDLPAVERLCLDVLAYAGIDPEKTNATWPTRFMEDTELTWMSREPAIDDL